MKSQKDIEKYLKLKLQIGELISDFEKLSSKKPDAPINKFKLKFVNQLLNEANSLLPAKLKPIDDFDLFDEEDMPSNSDALLVLNQYTECLTKFEKENTYDENYMKYWLINGKPSGLKK